MPVTVPVSILSNNQLLSCGLGILLYIVAGVLLMLAGRWLSKRRAELPGLLLFVCYAGGVLCVLFAIFDLTDLVGALGSLLL